VGQIAKSSLLIRFESFEVNLRSGELRSTGEKVRLPEQSFQILAMLLERPGEVVMRQEIQKRLWPNDTVVEFENSINAAVKRLRLALEDSADEPRYVETLPRRGYRWMVPVEWVDASPYTAQDAIPVAASLPADTSAPNLTGRKISHYRVLDILGGGGMGVVYKAEDLKLGRQVALKFLPEELGNDAKAVERFEREARATSALDHPNICSIYEFGEHEDQPFLVMQFLQGQTLRQLLENRRLENSKSKLGSHSRAASQSGPALPLEQLLDLAIQIADGLDAAHQKGIIHRDIKPANIFVTSQGQAKILDFGLAKLASLVTAAEDERDLPDGTNLEAHRETALLITPDPLLSRTGAAMGTAGYMSPEQVSGEKLDARTDLFSFGLVLYEMATGQRAFKGDTGPILCEAILKQAPTPARQLNPNLPAKLEAIVKRALEKDREARYQTAAEMRNELETIKDRWPVRHRWWGAVAGLTVLLATVGGGLYWRLARTANISGTAPITLSVVAGSQLQPTLLPLTSLAGDVVSPTFSPDGKRVAFGWNGENSHGGWDLYVKTVGMDRPMRLTEHPAPWLSAAWSPDGRNIAISRVAGESDAGVYLIPATGGPERQIAPAHFGRWGGNEISWSPNGKQIAFTDHPPASPIGTELLFLLSLDTSEAKAVKTDCRTAATPSFSPNGDLLAWVCVDTWNSVSLLTSRLSDGHTERLLRGIAGIQGIAWSEDGRRIVFSSPWHGDLWEASLSRPSYAEKLPFGHDASDVAASPAGRRLAFVEGATNVNIWRLDLAGSPPEARKFISSSREQRAPSISPTGGKIAFQSTRSGASEVWVCDADGSNAVQVTSLEGYSTGMPRWSPDGKWIAFDSRVGGEANIYVVNSNGGAARRLNIDIHGNNLPSWSHDGRWIYFVNREDARDPAIWKVPSEGGHAVRISETDATFPLESPDGQYVYFSHHRRLRRVRTDGSAEQEVAGMPELQFNGDTWAPTASGVYFMADVEHHTELDFFDFKTQKVRRVFTLEKSLPGWSGGVSISPDGKWLLYPQLDGSSSDLMMIENWK